MPIIFTILFSLLSSLSFATEVYVSRDANGNVVFSDRPSASSERHEVKELPSIPALTPNTSLNSPAKANEPSFSYTSLSILSPSNDQVFNIGQGGNVDISGVLVPNLREADTLYLLDNGNVIQEGRQTSVSLSNMDRGSHGLQFVVRDKQGKTLISSNTVTIHIQRASINNRIAPRPAR